MIAHFVATSKFADFYHGSTEEIGRAGDELSSHRRKKARKNGVPAVWGFRGATAYFFAHATQAINIRGRGCPRHIRNQIIC